MIAPVPYELRGTSVVRADTGAVVKSHPTREKALKHLRALKANVEESAGVLGSLLEGFAADTSPPAEWAGRFQAGDKVRVTGKGQDPIVGRVLRPHTAKPGSHVVVAPDGGGQAHVVAEVGSVRLDSPRQHTAARARAQRELEASQPAPGARAPGAPAAKLGAPPVREASITELLEAFAAPPASGPPETPAQSLQRARGQIAAAKTAQTAGWNASKHPRAQGGKFGYTTGGKRATRGKASTSRTVAHGAKGALVKAIQRQLHVKQDGIYGPQSRAAVTRFQQQHGLKVDGIVGAQTLAALRGNPNARNVKPGPITSKSATLRVPKAARVKRKGPPALGTATAKVPLSGLGGLVV